MGLSVGWGLFKKDDGPVKTTFSNNSENATQLRNEIISNVDTQMSTTANASNKVKIGKRVIKGNGNVVEQKIEMTAAIEYAQAVSQVIDSVMNASADTATKLDVLADVCQKVENTNTELQTPTTATTDVKLVQTNDVRLDNIQELNQSLRNTVALCANNDYEAAELEIEGNDNKITDNIKLKADAATNALIDMLSQADESMDDKLRTDMISSIKAQQETKNTGGLASVVGQLSNLGTTGMIAVIAIPIVIVVCICVLIACAMYFVLRKPADRYNGGMKYLASFTSRLH